jgi:hypothetical protein
VGVAWSDLDGCGGGVSSEFSERSEAGNEWPHAAMGCYVLSRSNTGRLSKQVRA